MTNTASPSLSKALGRAAKIFRLLEQRGMTEEGWKLLQDSPELQMQIVALCCPDSDIAMNQELLTLPGDDKLVSEMWSYLNYFFNDGGLRGHNARMFFQADLPSVEGIKYLLSPLNAEEIDLLVRVYGIGTQKQDHRLVCRSRAITTSQLNRRMREIYNKLAMVVDAERRERGRGRMGRIREAQDD